MYLILLKILLFSSIVWCKTDKNEKPKKKLSDYNDADVEKILDQWNENDEDYDEEDEPWKKPPPKINMEEITKAGGNKEDIMRATKKGQPVMIFVSLAGNPTKKQTEQISSFWQSSLMNNNIQVQRYFQVIDKAKNKLYTKVGYASTKKVDSY